MHKGAAGAFPFSRERGYFLAVCLRKIFPRKPEKGVFLNQFPEIWGVFQKLLEKLRKRGYDIYMFAELWIASRENEIGPLFHCISVGGTLEGSGKIRTHTVFHDPEEKKRKETKRKGKGVTIMSRDRGLIGKSSLERGWMLCGKARKMVCQFSRDRGCPVVRNTQTYPPPPPPWIYGSGGGGGGSGIVLRDHGNRAAHSVTSSYSSGWSGQERVIAGRSDSTLKLNGFHSNFRRYLCALWWKL